MRTYSPVLIELDDSSLPYYEDPVLPTTLDELDSILVLAPRYYIRLTHPSVHNTTGSLIHKSANYYIPRSGLLANTLKLKLRPSIGYGINSCYRVDYYSVVKHLLPTNYNPKNPFKPVNPTKLRYKDIPQAKHEHLKTEHWYIPNPDGTLNVNYSNHYNNSQPLLLPPLPARVKNNPTKTTSLVRADSNPDMQGIDYLVTPLDKEVIDIQSVTSDHSWEDYQLYEVPSYPFITSLTNESVTSAVGIAWGSAAPRPGTTYNITYTQPFTLRDIIFLPEERSSTIYPIRNQYGYPGLF